MKKSIGISILAVALTAPMSLFAAEQEEAKDSYVYSTYFYCNTSTQEKADELIAKNTYPIYDAAVADGTITGWGWMAHHTGGQWRRIQYHTSDSIAGLLTAQETLMTRMDEASGGADDGFGAICSAHDDYIWKSESGSATSGNRGKASISVYQVCDFTGEKRADEIVATVFAPVYDKAVADGKIKSWGWLSHVIGGEYRRLSTMSADSYTDLLAARAEILETIYGDGENPAGKEFGEICTSHTDYLWDIEHQKP
jgi:hypothetical protein